jgi:Zn-dependent protease/CBS domain-containing protein
MKWSWKVGHAAGIELRLHTTFVLFLCWIAAGYWMAARNVQAMLAGVALIVALFVCVLLHEMGHALCALRYGIKTKDITLLPIGGLARLERMPEEPRQELWIALAGPAVNVLIGAALYGWLLIEHQWEPFSRLGLATGPFVERLLVANISLALFNLIPAFPMDGGRVLRALLASRTDFARATQVSAWVGQAFAAGFFVLGLFSNPLLALIGVFIWVAARQEASAVKMRPILANTPAFAAMLTNFETLEARDSLADAVYRTLKGAQRDLPVVEQGHAIGMLTRADLLSALAEYGPERPVRFVMRGDFPQADADEKLDTVIERLRDAGVDTAPVVHNGRIVGLVSANHLDEYLLIRTILQQRGVRAVGVSKKAA